MKKRGKIYLHPVEGIQGKEVETLQVIFWSIGGRMYHMNMDRSGISEYEKLIARKSILKNEVTFFVTAGGLAADENPSDIQVTLKVSYPKPKARRKAV